MLFAAQTDALAESGCTCSQDVHVDYTIDDYTERLAVDDILNAYAFVGTQNYCMDRRFPLGTVY